MKRLLLIGFIAGLCMLLDYTVHGTLTPGGAVLGSVLGVLTGGAGVQTTFAGQSQCESYIVLDDVDTANALRGLTVEIDGQPFINIQNSAALMAAFAKWQMETISGTGVVGLMLKVATGSIRKNTTYRFTNDGLTTPTVRVFSDAQNGVPIVATTKGINASSFEDFSKFSALLITDPANVDSVEIVFRDGHKATMTIQEADALFSLKNQAEANGRLAAVSVIDNTDQSISSVRIFAAAAAITVLIAKLPNSVFN